MWGAHPLVAHTQACYLRDLGPGAVGTRPEVQARTWLSRSSAVVAVDDPVAVSRLYVHVERAASRHVVERRGERVDQRPTCRQRDYLGQLAPGYQGVRPEVQPWAWLSCSSAVVARYDAAVVSGLHVLEEGAAHGHILERGVG